MMLYDIFFIHYNTDSFEYNNFALHVFLRSAYTICKFKKSYLFKISLLLKS